MYTIFGFEFANADSEILILYTTHPVLLINFYNLYIIGEIILINKPVTFW